MIWQLALRNLGFRKLRTLFLLAGYGLGVAVMIVLLSVGDAMIMQASDEKLVGGGDVTVLPEGLDVEVMKTGGVGGLFFSIANARFLYQQLFVAPRNASLVRSVAPQVESKLLYLTLPGGREETVRAAGEIPDATRAVGAAAPLLAGEWRNDDGDRRWISPTLVELRHDADHFHLPPADLASPESWGEWHYFNVLSPDANRWYFITYMVAGAVGRGEWGGQLLVTAHETGRPARRYSLKVPRTAVRFSTRDADLSFGDAGAVQVRADGNYALRGVARAEDGSGAALRLDLVVTPAARAYFPGATLVPGDAPSGYAVLGLRASATGAICVAAGCESFSGAQAYHDHNWGTWQGVTWDWGAARAGSHTILYGRVRPAGSDPANDPPVFVYVVDSLGFRAVFRPRQITYDDARVVAGPGRGPATARLYEVRGSDTLDLQLTVDDAVASDTRGGLVDRGEGDYARGLRTPWFLQMKGRARLSGRAGGVALSGEGLGFFETYR
ncbi:MAG TPA: ABC transporter permease [Gemmatimonadaceae bacterium]|nr:ABC transporter permease [Gemmatimonadaceae bacterium]